VRLMIKSFRIISRYPPLCTQIYSPDSSFIMNFCCTMIVCILTAPGPRFVLKPHPGTGHLYDSILFFYSLISIYGINLSSISPIFISPFSLISLPSIKKLAARFY
jgi:hypothetical protein